MASNQAKHRERMDWLRALAVREPISDCVDWPWGLDADGYPAKMYAGRWNVRVSHVMMELLGRPRQPGMLVLHSCDRPPCLAPWHLRWGTPQQNMDDKVVRRRHRTGEQAPQAKLTQDQVDAIRAAVTGGATQLSQAREYDVAPSLISMIVRGVIWKPVHR